MVRELGDYLSEAGLNRARIQVEIEWLIWLCDRNLLGSDIKLTDADRGKLRAIFETFDESGVTRLAEIEAETRHDVKAVEYYIREQLPAGKRGAWGELVHWGCTSEDINNLSYAIVVNDAVERVWLPRAKVLVQKIARMAQDFAEVPMLSRTHGQPATPTTMGKEFAVYAHRLQRQLSQISAQSYLGKFSGATGTFSAHVVAAPNVDWLEESRQFVESLGLEWNPLTTQIESHDWQAELYSRMSHFNRVLHNICTDVWTYISLNYFKQIPVAGATGSSTMPHKVNPIRFENAEANLELSSALLESLASTLVTSRLQRDLTDSTSQRNIGVAFGHSLLAIENVLRGLDELAINDGLMAADLLENLEVLGEAIQTVIRAEVAAGRSKIKDPYAMLKELTRGKKVSDEELAAFINKLDIGDEAKDRLLNLTPAKYVGLAATLAHRVVEN